MKEEGAKLYLRKDGRNGAIAIEIHNYNYEEFVYSVQRENLPLIQWSGEVRYDGMSIPITLSTKSLTGQYVDEPLPEGTYNLKAPDFPHSGTYSRNYRPNRDKGQFDMVWFPIEYENNTRYLHMGHVSEGCVTITNINAWESLYRKIIRCRSDGDTTDKIGGGKYVGKLIVSKDFTRKPMNKHAHPLSSF